MDLKHAVKWHSEAANSAGAWESSASSLLVAADVLRERRSAAEHDDEQAIGAWRTHPPELMLRGMAVECLLKALWVTRGHLLAVNGRYKGIPSTKEHDLVRLAAALDLELSALERDVLRRLSAFSQYGGRYPVPKQATELQLVPSPSGGRTAATTWTTPDDYLLFEEIVRQLDTLLGEHSG